MHQRFGIAVGSEVVTLANQIGSQFLVVVNLAIEYYPDSSVFVRNWLVAGGQIDDAEPPHADAAAAIEIKPFILWAAVPDLVAHRANSAQFHLPLSR